MCAQRHLKASSFHVISDLSNLHLLTRTAEKAKMPQLILKSCCKAGKYNPTGALLA